MVPGPVAAVLMLYPITGAMPSPTLSPCSTSRVPGLSLRERCKQGPTPAQPPLQTSRRLRGTRSKSASNGEARRCPRTSTS